MKILKVRVKNLNSLRLETEIDLASAPLGDTGLFAIVGDTGSGKTTILDAITLAMYGKIARNKEVKEIISYGAPDSYAEVEFEAKENLYLAQWNVWRARGKVDGNVLGPNRKLSKWDKEKEEFIGVADKIREVEMEIENITGLDYERFKRSVLLSQGDFAAFLKSNEKERSDLLERITGTEIYSNISKAAFQKYRAEEAVLNNLRQELERLKILDKEELKELKTELKKSNQESKALKKNLQKWRAQAESLKRIEDLEKRKEKLESDANQLKEKANALDEANEKLQRHQKAFPFQNQLLRVQEKTNQVIILEKNRAVLEVRRNSIELEKNARAEEFKLAETDWKAIKSSEKELQEVFEKVAELDIKIQEKNALIAPKKLELETEEKSLNDLVEKTVELEKKQVELSNELEQNGHWLKENKNLKSLIEDLPAIELMRKELQEAWKKKSAAKKEAKSLQKVSANLEKEGAKIAQQLQKLSEKFENLQSKFKEISPENFAESRSELLNLISQEIEQMTLQGKNLKQLEEWNATYKEMVVEMTEMEQQLTELRSREIMLNNELMTALEVYDNAEKQLSFKQQVYEEQQLIANYEKDRMSLKDGEECPLCFSTEHPFRNKDFKPFLNEAKSEFESAKSWFEKSYEKYKDILWQHQEVGQSIAQIANNEQGQMSRQLEKILDFEAKFSGIISSVTGIDLFSKSESGTATLFEKELNRKKDLRLTLTALNKQLEQEEKALNAIQQKAKDFEFQEQQIKHNQNHNLQKINEIETKFESTKKNLDEILKKYGYQFDEKTAREMFDDLKERRILFNTNSDNFLQAEKQLELTKQELKIVQKNKKDLEKRIEKLKQAFEKENVLLDQLKSARFELFGAKNLANEKENFYTNLQSKNQLRENSKAVLDSTILEFQNVSNQLKNIEKDLKSQQKTSKDLERKLIQKIKKAGFENFEILENALLSQAESNKIENAITRYKKAEIELQQAMKTVISDLNKAQKANKAEQPLEAIKAQIQEWEIAEQALNQSIGALQEKMDENDRRKQAAQELLQQIENQRVNYNRWAKLNDLIGSADGKKFRVFAQGLTLKKLTNLANIHLKNLNGRYLINKRSDQDLQLDIIDTYQADNVRSMNTLSGGESFLVSLSLALGLSDLAGRNTNIRSLFIDEGFGTLDENALDIAISTLENLQAKGKTIGVISHVKELKERITTQIQVHKRGNGFSEIVLAS